MASKRLLPHMTAVKRGHFKYQRAVPTDLHGLVLSSRGTLLKKWDYSLGTDLAAAKKKAAAYAQEHDDLIASLATPEAREARALEIASGAAAHLVRGVRSTPDVEQPFIAIGTDGGWTVSAEWTPHVRYSFDAVADQQPAEAPALYLSPGDKDLWRTTEAVLGAAESLPDAEALQHLAGFAVAAFGDHSKAQHAGELGHVLTEYTAPERPVDLTGGAVFDAMRGALDNRIQALVNRSAEADKYRLSTLAAQYMDLKGSSASTRRSYSARIKALTDFAGDLPLDAYTPTVLRAWRDDLMQRMDASSVPQFFAPVRSILRWAIADELVPGLDSLATEKVRMPSRSAPVEQTKWKRFDDDQIKEVRSLFWKALEDVGPEKAALYKVVFRVLLYTGLRPVEVFRLTPGDVTESVIHVKKTKTKVARDLPVAEGIKDFPGFIHSGAFACIKNPERDKERMSTLFTNAIRGAGFEDRYVLYSTKDTLVDRLKRAGAADDVVRAIIGHTDRTSLRNYTTRLNDTPEGLTTLKGYLDRIEYF